ncbi:serine/threonine protein kinase [Streptosporangium sp. NBC_01495]|uniref:WD40 repeat domain-containing serine/threonine protein kinase n=1 Tax=Streptosporangium sp. NBC_01495 TaxID=2903899 RepID=UPI002E359E07|nr:serine/threonine-protein kinase [Streptosporangium sp. NBC_01495]
MANDAGRLVAGRYRLMDVLGRGGMGTVWRARDESLHRQVAIKELTLPDHLDVPAREMLYRRMQREARAAAQLKHPAIITVHDHVVEADGRPWIVTEIIDGPSLDEVLRTRGRLPPQRVAAIGGQILAALTVAHAAGITHRDIKPANVLLEGERVVLTDFGIAAVEGDVTLTAAGVTLGTPAFISPEQINGHPATAASDLWSLGATLYAAVEGRRPFSGTTHGSIYVSIATRPPAPPVHAGPLAPLLEGLLRKDPALRLTGPQAAGALAEIAATPAPGESSTGPGPESGQRPGPESGRGPDDGDTRIADRPALPTPAPPPPTEPYATAHQEVGQEVRPPVTLSFTAVSPASPPTTSPPGPPPAVTSPALASAETTARTPRHRLRPVAAVAAALLSTAATVAYLLWPATGPAKVTAVAQLRGHTETVNAVAFSPDGETLASGGGDGAVIMWNARTRRPIGDPLTGHTRAVQAMAFSPDGGLLASGGSNNEGTDPGDHTVVLWDTRTRRPIGDPLTGHTNWVESVAFSPDGRTLATGSSDKTVIVWDTRTWQPIGDPLTGHNDWVQAVAFSPDGRTLATVGDDMTVIVWDTATWRPVGAPLTGHTRSVLSVAFSPDGKTLASGSGDKTVIVWDTATRRPVGAPLTGHPGEIHTLAFGPDGDTLAVGTGSVVRLWDTRTWRPIGDPLTGHTGSVWSMAFSPDGETLATAGEDRQVIMWGTFSPSGAGTAVSWPWLAGAGVLVVAAAGALVIRRRRAGRASAREATEA